MTTSPSPDDALPDEAHDSTTAPALSDHQRDSARTAIFERIDKKDLIGAQEVLDAARGQLDRDVYWTHELQGEILDAQREYRRALAEWDTARRLAPENPEVIAEYIYTLAFLGCIRTALNEYSQLTSHMKRSEAVKSTLVAIYELAEWPAHKLDAIADRDQFEPTEVILDYLPIILTYPIRIRVEQLEIEALDSETEFIDSTVRAISFPTPEQRFDTYAEIDEAAKATAVFVSRQRLVANVFDWVASGLLLVAACVYWLLLAQNPVPIDQLTVVITTATIVYYLASRLWDAISSFVASVIIVVVVATALGAAGAFLFLRAPVTKTAISSYSAALALLTAAVAIIATLVAIGIANSFETRAFNKISEEHARGVLLGLLSTILARMRETPRRTGLSSVRWEYRTISLAANVLEIDLPKQYRTNDKETDAWLKEQCQCAANALRATRYHGHPRATSVPNKLRRTVQQVMTAIALEHWSSLPRRQSAETPSPSRREYAVRLTRSLGIALLPAVLLFVARPWLSLDPPIIGWAQLAVLGWAAISLLFIIDPRVRDRIDASRDLVTSVRSIVSGDPVEPSKRDGAPRQSL